MVPGLGGDMSGYRDGRCSFALVLVAIGHVASVGLSGQARVPELVIEAASSLSAMSEQIRRLDEGRLASVMRLTGLSDPGPAIRVVLLSEESAIARETPPWVAGYADQRTDVVVLFPGRIGSYPYNSLENVLYHEVAHVLTGRAAGNAPVPRWFNEGLASAAERSWGLEARSRFAWEVLVGGQLTATELEGLFGQGPREVVRAYAMADALVRDLLMVYGPSAPARILNRMADGQLFEQALYAVTGASVREIFGNFWRRHQLWELWIDTVGHPSTLWTLITTLALAAIWRHRRRRVQQRLQWEREERAEQQEWEDHRRRDRAH